MPAYDYTCSNCNYSFEIEHSIHEEARKKCPKCKKHKLERVPGGGLGFWIYGNPTTLGQQAEVNSRKMGKELRQIKTEEEKQKFKKIKQKALNLPSGAKIIEPDEKYVPWYRSGKKPLNLDKAKNDPNYKDIIKELDTNTRLKRDKNK